MDELCRKLDTLMAKDCFSEAEDLLLSEREKALCVKDYSLELSLCNELLGHYRMRVNMEKFFPVWERTKELLLRLDPPDPDYATILINGATAMVSFSLAEESLPYFQEAEDRFFSSMPSEHPLFAALYNNWASAYLALGSCDEAECLMKKALRISSQICGNLDCATTLVNLARLYQRQDPSDPRITSCLSMAMERFDDPAVLWDGYYSHTAKKCAGAFAEMGWNDIARELEERAAILL